MRFLKRCVCALSCLAVAGVIGCSSDLSMNPSSEGARTVAAVSTGTTLPGNGQDIAICCANLYMVSTSGLGWMGESYGYDIYQWGNGGWEISNFNGKGSKIDMNVDGYPYVIDKNNKLFRGIQGTWIKLSGPGTNGIAKDFGAGRTHNYVWATNGNDELFRGIVSYSSAGSDNVTGISWTKWGGTSYIPMVTRAKHLDVDSAGDVWFYDMDRNTLAYSSPTNQPGSKMLAASIPETGEYLDVAADNNKNPFVLLGVNGYAKIYRWDSYAWTWTYENFSLPYSPSQPIGISVRANGLNQDGSLGYEIFVSSGSGNYELQSTSNSSSQASDGVVAYYPFINGAKDVASSPANGNPVGGILATPDRRSQRGSTDGFPNCAYRFDGVSSYIDLGDPAKLQFPNGSMSIAAIIKIPSPQNANRQIVFRGDDRPGMDPYMLYVTANNEIAFSICNSAGQGYTVKYSYPSAYYGMWIPITVTLDGATGKVALYIASGLVASGITTVRPFAALTGTKGVRIGSYVSSGGSPGQYWNGVIDNVAFFNKALSPVEIRGHGYY